MQRVIKYIKNKYEVFNSRIVLNDVWSIRDKELVTTHDNIVDEVSNLRDIVACINDKYIDFIPESKTRTVVNWFVDRKGVLLDGSCSQILNEWIELNVLLLSWYLDHEDEFVDIRVVSNKMRVVRSVMDFRRNVRLLRI